MVGHPAVPDCPDFTLVHADKRGNSGKRKTPSVAAIIYPFGGQFVSKM